MRVLSLTSNLGKAVVLGFMCVLSVAEIYTNCRTMGYFPDEIYNLDTIVTFFTKLDYTSQSQGGHPFDPVLSAGILATWMHGVVFYMGGSLFSARILTAMTHFLLAVLLVSSLFRRCGFAPLEAMVLALSVWTSFIPAGSHELRIINAGEVWGALYLAAGVLLSRTAPNLAVFFWGLATWSVKIIYLPFTGLLVVALAIAEMRERCWALSSGRSLRMMTRLAFSFLLPLLAWMLLIWARYDARTLALWASSYVAFVTEHAANVAINPLPKLSGWDFHVVAADQSVLKLGRHLVLTYVLPLAFSGVALIAFVLACVTGVVRAAVKEKACIAALAVGVLVETIWFFAFDVTQWGRHLMPAIYVGVVLGGYCLARIWQSCSPSSASAWACGVAASVVILFATWASYDRTSHYLALRSWMDSYAVTCHGLNVLEPPCAQESALKTIPSLVEQVCHTGETRLNPEGECVRAERPKFMEAMLSILDDPDASADATARAIYLFLFFQGHLYDWESDYLSEVAPLVCAKSSVLRQRLRTAHVDVSRLTAACASAS